MTALPATGDLGDANVDPTNDVPASATIRASSLPLAPISGPSPEMLAAGEKLAALLPMAVQSLEGKALAVFDWQTVTGNEGRTSVSVSGCDGNTFELVWAHGDVRQAVRVRVEVYCTRHDELVMRLRVRGKLRWVRLLFDGPDPVKTRYFLTSRKRGFGIGSGTISSA